MQTAEASVRKLVAQHEFSDRELYGEPEQESYEVPFNFDDLWGMSAQEVQYQPQFVFVRVRIVIY